MEYCSPCERYFPSRVALQQHQQTSGRHTYDCSRCQKHFGSYFAQRQHVRNSPRHHVCTDCTQGQDFNSEYELDQHAATYHNLCRTCDRSFDTPEQVVQHDVAQHYMCLTCRHYFQSSSNLKNHLKTHAEKTTHCFGCTRLRFVSTSAMVLHLEAGTCASGVTVDDVTDIAFDCYQSKRYTSDHPNFNFKCPTCGTAFSFMSALLQHAESDYCDENLADEMRPLGKFLHYLQLRT